MYKKQIAIGFIIIFSLISLLIFSTFFNHYNFNSTLEFTSQHLIVGIMLLIVLRALSNVLPVIPGGMIIFAAVPIIGWFPAFTCNLFGLMLGKSVAFFLARFYREPLVERFASLNKIHQLEKQVTGKRQFLALLAFKTFTVPVVDISSYIIGLTKISFLKFAFATFLAALPTIVAFYLGQKFYDRFFGNHLLLGAFSMLILGIIYFIIKKYWLKKEKL